MAQNVTIAGAAYSNVPAVDLPKTGGGTARFYDTQGNKALSPSLSEQTGVDVKSYATASVAAITKELLAQLDGDFVAENIKKDVDLFGLVGTLEGGGGGGLDWINDYTNFTAGTFIPAETTESYTIDTGVPYRASGYLQELIMWSDPAARYGLIIGYMSSLVTGSANSKTIAVIGYYSAYVAKTISESTSPLPAIGETAWTIAGLSSSTNFRAGKTYHWMLLEKAK